VAKSAGLLAFISKMLHNRSAIPCLVISALLHPHPPTPTPPSPPQARGWSTARSTLSPAPLATLSLVDTARKQAGQLFLLQITSCYTLGSSVVEFLQEGKQQQQAQQHVQQHMGHCMHASWHRARHCVISQPTTDPSWGMSAPGCEISTPSSHFRACCRVFSRQMAANTPNKSRHAAGRAKESSQAGQDQLIAEALRHASYTPTQVCCQTYWQATCTPP
jgi:hypothetical protein